MSTSEWFHIIGLISAAALGIGFVAGLVSVGLSWRINQEQKLELEKVKTDAETRLQVETEKVRIDADKSLKLETAKVRAEADTEGKRIESNANRKIEEARAQAQADVAAARLRQDEIALELRDKAKELADAQREAAVAQLALKKHLEEVAERQKPRHLTPTR